MSDHQNPFDNLPGFKETIVRIAQVPAQNAPKQSDVEFTYKVKDETNTITYKLISPKRLTAADIRRALVRAFSRTDAWPNDSREVEIRL